MFDNVYAAYDAQQFAHSIYTFMKFQYPKVFKGAELLKLIIISLSQLDPLYPLAQTHVQEPVSSIPPFIQVRGQADEQQK